MGSSHESFGVTCRKWIPLAWRSKPDSARTPERRAWLNQVNEKRLQTLVERETRERPSAEIANLEALLIEVLHCVKQSPPARSVVLSGHGVEWIETSSRNRCKVGDTGTVRMGLDADLPYEVEFSADIVAVEDDARGDRVTAQFVGQSERVMDLYEQLVFIYYRRGQREERLAADPE